MNEQKDDKLLKLIEAGWINRNAETYLSMSDKQIIDLWRVYNLEKAITKQREISKITNELENVGITLCGCKNDSLQIYTIEMLSALAEIYEKEIEFIPFDLKESVFEIKGYFHVNETNIFALGKEKDISPQAKEKYLKNKEIENESE